MNYLKNADGKIALTVKDKSIIVQGCFTSLQAHVVANKLLFFRYR